MTRFPLRRAHLPLLVGPALLLLLLQFPNRDHSLPKSADAALAMSPRCPGSKTLSPCHTLEILVDFSDFPGGAAASSAMLSA
jgi:hypothetical protein